MVAASQARVLAVRDLGFKRGERWIFRHLDFELRAGDFMALVGPSGVGKSTLLFCLCGFRRPDEGEVSLHLPG